jgi:hypothetical protein
MRNSVDIDHTHCRAINREIGERLRTLLSVDAETPLSLRGHLDRFRVAEDQSPSIIPTSKPWDLS